MKLVRWFVLLAYLALAAAPLAWMALSSLKRRDDTIAPHAKLLPGASAVDDPTSPWFEATLAAYRDLGAVHAGAQESFLGHLASSVVIGLLSTIASSTCRSRCG